MILYHATTDEAACSILRDGFRDPDPEARRTKFHGGTGIWLSDYPAKTIYDFAQGDVLLEVTFDCDESDLAKWDESINPEPGEREWCVPTEVVNQKATVRRLSRKESEDVRLCHSGAPLEISVK